MTSTGPAVETGSTQSAAPKTSSQKKKLVLLDDEPDILKALTRLLRKEYDINSFENGHDALAFLGNNKVDLIVSDMRMPIMKGTEFLAKAKDIQPDTVRLLLTGYSEMEATVSAINEGGIFAYISKPWDNNELKLVLKNAVKVGQLEKEKLLLTEQLAARNRELEDFNNNLEDKVTQRSRELAKSHQKLKKQHETQRNMYQNLISMLADIIEQHHGQGSGHVQRIADQCRMLARKMEFDKAQTTHVYLGALISDIGTIVLNLPSGTDYQSMTSEQRREYDSHPLKGAAILDRLPAFRTVADIIRHQKENVDGTGEPNHLRGKLIPEGARILRIVKAYDEMVSGRITGVHKMPQLAKQELKDNIGKLYDEQIVDQFITLLEQRPTDEVEGVEYCIGLDEVKVGDVLKRDLLAPTNDLILFTVDHEITSENLSRLRQYEKENEVRLALFV